MMISAENPYPQMKNYCDDTFSIKYSNNNSSNSKILSSLKFTFFQKLLQHEK